MVVEHLFGFNGFLGRIMFRVRSLGLRAREESLRFRVWDTGYNCSGSRFRVRVEDIGFRIRAIGFGFRIWAWGLGFRV